MPGTADNLSLSTSASDTVYISPHLNLATTLSSWHYSSFHLAQVEIEALAQNVAVSTCPSLSQLFPCISISLPLLLVWLHAHGSPHSQTPLHLVQAAKMHLSNIPTLGSHTLPHSDSLFPLLFLLTQSWKIKPCEWPIIIFKHAQFR